MAEEVESETETEIVDVSAAPVLDIADIIARLVPENEVTIEDVKGNKYKYPAVLSARKTMQLTRALGKIFDGSAGYLPADPGLDVETFMAVITSAQDVTIIDDIAAMFATALPDVVSDGKKKLKFKADADAADVFPLEEMIAGLIPLFARAAHRVTALWTTATKDSQETS